MAVLGRRCLYIYTLQRRLEYRCGRRRALKRKKKANRKYFTIQEVTEQKTRIMTKKTLDELVISAISPCSRADCRDLDNPQYLHS